MSLAAGVLTAALALPPQGLVAAYDFARTNFLNWSEDFTNGVWAKNRIDATPNRLTIASNPTGFDYVWQAIPSAAQGQTVTAYADMMQGNSAVSDLRILTNNGSTPIRSARIRWSDRTLIPHPDGATIGTVTSEERGGGVLRVTITVTLPALTAGTGVFIYPNGWNSALTPGAYVDVLRAQWQLGSPAGYEKQTDAQVLLDRSVRLWPAPAARTNLLRWTEDFTQSVWVASGATLSDPGLTDPLTGAKAVRVTTTGADPFLFQHIPGIPSGLTVSMSVRVKAEGSLVGRQFRLYLYGTSGAAEAVGVSGYTFATGDWQTLTFTRTFPAGMASTSWVWRVDTFESGQQIGDTILVAAPMVNYGPATLPYERQTDGVTYDLSQRGMRNLIPNSELARSSDTAAPTGWSVQIPSGVSASWSYGVAASGVPYVQLTLTGTVSATGAAFNIYMSPTGAAGVPVTPGIAYNSSVNITQVSGPAFQIQAGAHFWNTTGTYVGTAGAGASGVGDDPLRIAATVIVPSTAQYATPRLGALNFWPVESSQTRVYRISQPQFEIGSTAATYQRSPSHGTLGSSSNADSNDPAWTPQGLSFDGVDDYATAPQPPISSDGPFTVIVVATQPTQPGGTAFSGVIALASATAPRSNPHIVFRGNGTGNTVGFGLYGDDIDMNVPGVFGVPVLMAMTYGGLADGVRALRAHVRGVGISASASKVVGGAVSLGPAPMLFGRIHISSAMYSSARLHYVAIYNRALTDAEVHQAHRFIRNQLSRRGVTI